jgi:hypothetical protein
VLVGEIQNVFFFLRSTIGQSKTKQRFQQLALQARNSDRHASTAMASGAFIIQTALDYP